MGDCVDDLSLLRILWVFYCTDRKKVRVSNLFLRVPFGVYVSNIIHSFIRSGLAVEPNTSELRGNSSNNRDAVFGLAQDAASSGGEDGEQIRRTITMVRYLYSLLACLVIARSFVRSCFLMISCAIHSLLPKKGKLCITAARLIRATSDEL